MKSMARKRTNPIEHPPSPSSSEEEEKEEKVVETEDEEEDDDNEGSSSEEEEEDPKNQAATQIQKTPPTKKSAAPAAAQSDESDSWLESESDTAGAAPEVKPIATKPMEENSKKGRSKSLASPAKASSSKRASESEQGTKQAKRAKKKAGEEGTVGGSAVAEAGKKTGEDAKKQLFQRLFTEDDEIALLKGMLDYHAKKGVDPCADMNAFYDYVKKFIHTDVTKAQMMDKVRRLRKKYENNVGKGKHGEEKTFSKAHEQKGFDLSKKIWGKEGFSGKNENSVAKSNGKSKAMLALKAELLSPQKKVDCGEAMKKVDGGDAMKKVDGGEAMDIDKKGSDSGVCLFDKRYGGVGGLEEAILKHGLDKVGAEKKAALEGRWRKVQIAELEMFVERCELMAEQGKALLESYKSENK